MCSTAQTCQMWAASQWSAFAARHLWSLDWNIRPFILNWAPLLFNRADRSVQFLAAVTFAAREHILAADRASLADTTGLQPDYKVWLIVILQEKHNMQADQRTLELLSLCVCVTDAGLICDKKALAWRCGQGSRSAGGLDHRRPARTHARIAGFNVAEVEAKPKCQPLIDTGVSRSWWEATRDWWRRPATRQHRFAGDRSWKMQRIINMITYNLFSCSLKI